MNITFPSPPQGYSQAFMTSALQAVQRAMNSAVSSSSASNRILLQSPDGTVFELVVGDDGNLATIPLAGGEAP
jgi:hypothetical protein